jgi:hypothetical protein
MLRLPNSRTAQEPRYRRQLRLVHALLAFPAAGIIGFTGNAIVKSVRSELAPITSPAKPDPAGEEQPASYDPDDEQDSPPENSHVARNV